MKKFTLIIVIILLTVSFGYSQGTELSYDSNHVTHYQAYEPDHVFAVRMSPDEPCEVLTLKYLCKKEGLSEAGFFGLVYAWEGDKPAATPVFQRISAVVIDDWKEVEVDELVSFEGEFVVGFTPNDAAAFLAYDSLLLNDRNWVLDETETWTLVETHAFLIRAIVQYTSTGIIDELEGESIDVYPNPATDLLTVKVDENVSQISIYNSIGKVVFVSDEIVPGINNIDVSKYLTGVYFIRVDSGNGPII